MAATSDVRSGPRPSRLARWTPGQLVLRSLLRHFARGRLSITLPSGERMIHQGAQPGTEAAIVLHRWRPLLRLLTAGDIGLAESYVDGDWSSPDLTSLLMVAGENIAALEPVIAGKLPVRLLQRLRHLRNRNTRTGSRRNIASHYDLGNAFYAHWLDRGMMYSAAIYPDEHASLEEAQQHRLDHIAGLLALGGGEQVLEIGCGWGSLAAKLAGQGASVTALTLSREQQRHAEALVQRNNLGAAVEVRLEDYRDVQGTFDRIVSIEMLEAVGEAYWPSYFAKLRSALKRGGAAVLQVITIDEARFEGYRRSPDFIQRHIFPGGMLPTRTILLDQARRHGFSISSVEMFGRGYALTLAEWRRRFTAAWPSIEQQGFDRRFRRLWEYYLCYCEAGFRAGLIDVGLYRLQG